jgi:hypothetical protein
MRDQYAALAALGERITAARGTRGSTPGSVTAGLVAYRDAGGYP